MICNLYRTTRATCWCATYRHVSSYIDLDPQETVEVAELTQQAIRMILHVSGPAGFNLGMNQGQIAGAGIAAHLHQHIVPRWQGDANFLPVIGRTKALPQFLADTRQLFADGWAELFGTTESEGQHA